MFVKPANYTQCRRTKSGITYKFYCLPIPLTCNMLAVEDKIQAKKKKGILTWLWCVKEAHLQSATPFCTPSSIRIITLPGEKKKKDSQSNSPWSFCEDNLWETLSAINNSTATMHTTWIYAPAVTFLITASLC